MDEDIHCFLRFDTSLFGSYRHRDTQTPTKAHTNNHKQSQYYAQKMILSQKIKKIEMKRMVKNSSYRKLNQSTHANSHWRAYFPMPETQQSTPTQTKRKAINNNIWHEKMIKINNGSFVVDKINDSNRTTSYIYFDRDKQKKQQTPLCVSEWIRVRYPWPKEATPRHPPATNNNHNHNHNTTETQAHFQTSSLHTTTQHYTNHVLYETLSGQIHIRQLLTR